MASSIGSSIISSLGAGSGINTSSLVSDLVSAVREPKETAITTNQSLNSSRVSAVASAISSIQTFSSTLTSLLKDTSYSGQPASSNTGIASVSAISGGTPSGLPAQIEVKQLAQAQVVKSGTLSGASSTVGTGSLTLTTATGSYDISISSGNNSLTGLAAAINDSKSGVTATVMTDAAGSRLVLKGANGEENGFSLTMEADDTADADLQRFTFGSTGTNVDTSATSSMTQTQSTQNAQIVLDGVEMEYADNVVTDAIPYVRIDLNSASPGTTVTLATDEPASTMADLLQDFVDGYNSMRSALNTATRAGTDSSSSGVLSGVSGIRDMKSQLAALTTTQLSTDGPYKTLSDIGITTNRDGTLSLDTERLAQVMEQDPDAVTQLINPTASTEATLGLAKAVENISDNLLDEDGALTLLQERYSDLAEKYTDQLADLDESMSDYQDRLTKIYSAMETRLSSIKATQSYLEQQIAVWNGSDD